MCKCVYAVCCLVLITGCGSDPNTKFLAAVADVREGRSSSIDVRSSPVTDVSLLVNLKGLDNLQTLNVDRSPVTDEALASIGPLPELRSLSLSRTQITNESLKLIVDHYPELIFLRLDETAVSDAGMAELTRAGELKELSLYRTPVGSRGCGELAKIKTLQRLSLDQTMVTDEAFAALKTLPELERLSIWQCQTSRKAAERFMADCPDVKVNQ